MLNFNAPSLSNRVVSCIVKTVLPRIQSPQLRWQELRLNTGGSCVRISPCTLFATLYAIAPSSASRLLDSSRSMTARSSLDNSLRSPPTGPNIWLISVDFVSYVSSPSPSPGPRSGADTQALLTCARNRSPHSSPAFQLPRLFTPRKPSCFKWRASAHSSLSVGTALTRGSVAVTPAQWP